MYDRSPIHIYKSQSSNQWEGISHIQFTLISLNSNLSFGRVESKNLPLVLDLRTMVDDEEAGD